MAVYGVDFYGKSKYGPNIEVDFSVQPFYVVRSDYSKVVLSWTPPSNVSAYIRLVRNSIGWPSREDDGKILLTNDVSTEGAISSYVDSDIVPGHYYYYGIFAALHPAWSATIAYNYGDVVGHVGKFYTVTNAVGNIGQEPNVSGTYWTDSTADANWVVAGAVSNLVVADNGYQDRLYKLIPRPYKGADNFVTEVEDENPPLYDFLKTFSYHLDEIKTNYDKLLDVNNWLKATEPQAQSLAAQFGVDNDPTLPAHFRRTRLRDSAHLYREKGTQGGLRGILNAALGWDADIVIGPNLMLNDDQTNFAHPVFDAWNPSVNYAGPVPAVLNGPAAVPGQRVQYNGNIYSANTGGAYGDAQRPTGIATSNTWWTWVNNDITDSSLYNPTTGGVSTWGVRSFTPTVVLPAGGLALSVGLPDALNSGQTTNNAGYAKNNSATLIDLGVESIAPVVAPAWIIDHAYAANAYVTYNSRVWRSLTANNIGIQPATDAYYWSEVYIDTLNGIDFPKQVVCDGIPTPLPIPSWTSDVAFKVGDIASYLGSDYQALVATVGNAPTGHPNSNSYWQYLNPDQDAYTASGFTTMPAGAAPTMTKMTTAWYTDKGGFLGRMAGPNLLTYVDTFDDVVPKASRLGVAPSGGYAPPSGGATTWRESNGVWPSIYGWVYPQPTAGLAATINLVTNPSFEVNTTNWNTTASALTTSVGSVATRDTTQSVSTLASGASARLNTTGSNANQGIWSVVTGLSANTTYTVSVYVKVASGRPVTMRVKDVTNNVVVGGVGGYISPAAFTRITATITIGSLAPTGGLLVAVHTDSTLGTASVFYVDAVQVEAGSVATTYLDGINGGKWLNVAAPNNSTSQRVTTISMLHMQTYRSDLQIGLTFRTQHPGKSEGLAFRIFDTANFWAANWYGLYMYSNGAASGYSYLGGPLNSGDRIIVTAKGTVVTVNKYLPAKSNGSPNLKQLVVMNYDFFTTATRAGMYTEI